MLCFLLPPSLPSRSWEALLRARLLVASVYLPRRHPSVMISSKPSLSHDWRGPGGLGAGATNRPQELDDAARRRLQKRLLIPLPDQTARREMLQKGLHSVKTGHSLTETELDEIVAKTAGYSGSDMAGLCREAAMEPLRDDATMAALMRAPSGQGQEVHVRPMTQHDFHAALCQIRPSVSDKELRGFEDWNAQFGSFANPESKRQALGQ
mmetsp:Transcript_77676/g.154323  ORF Transcript_77676/g.154323 Transcript_77676/m.154323 type:complete len:209 (+) Transcript_77676:650-1276(+)